MDASASSKLSRAIQIDLIFKFEKPIRNGSAYFVVVQVAGCRRCSLNPVNCLVFGFLARSSAKLVKIRGEVRI